MKYAICSCGCAADHPSDPVRAQPMRVIFLNRFFYPDGSATSQMLSDLTAYLGASEEVHVITSRLLYDDPTAWLCRAERVKGVQVHRIWTSRFGRASLLGRTSDYFTFYVFATLRLLRVAKRGDVVVAMTDPPLISIPAALVARAKGARLVNWLHDIFPEIASELDFRRVPAWIGRAVAWCRDRSLDVAAANVVVGDVMAERVMGKGIPPARITVIHNWSSGDEIKPIAASENCLRREWQLDGKYVVGYSGNMGRAHEFSSLLQAAERLSGHTDIAFLLIGGGKQRAAIEAEVRWRKLKNVMFRPYQPRELLAQSLTAPDCHIVSLKPRLEGLIVPSKLYSSLAAGRPVIFLGAEDGEIGRMMRANPEFGHRLGPDDVAGLSEIIERLNQDRELAAVMGSNGRGLFERKFDRPIALDHWNTLLRRVSSTDEAGHRVVASV